MVEDLLGGFVAEPWSVDGTPRRDGHGLFGGGGIDAVSAVAAVLPAEKFGLAIVGYKVYYELQGLRVSASTWRLACTNRMVKIRMNRRDDEGRVAVDGAG